MYIYIYIFPFSSFNYFNYMYIPLLKPTPLATIHTSRWIFNAAFQGLSNLDHTTPPLFIERNLKGRGYDKFFTIIIKLSEIRALLMIGLNARVHEYVPGFSKGRFQEVLSPKISGNHREASVFQFPYTRGSSWWTWKWEVGTKVAAREEGMPAM